MSKQVIKFGKEGREKVLNGVRMLAKAVKSTLGPGGRNAIFMDGQKTTITKDGVTVAKHVKPTDPLELMGANIIREASEQTAFLAGDGTSTSALLAEAITEEGYKRLTAGFNPISLQRGILSAARTITTYIKEHVAQPCTTEQVKHIALVSTNWDNEIASLISEAVTHVGKDGSVSVSESRSAESYNVYTDGLEIERGYNSPYFINNEAKSECVFDNPLIFMSGLKITNNLMLKPIFDNYMKVSRGQQPLLIIAPDVENEAISTLVINKVNGIVNVCSIKCPGFGDRMKDQMYDLEALLGGTYFTDILNRDFTTITKEDFGTCDRVTINRDKTIFVNGGGSEEAITNRINHIKELLDNDPEGWRAREFKERIAKLSGGVAVVYVGAQTEAELKERQDRVDDAICATRAAIATGVLPGGGATLAKISGKKLKYETGDEAFNAGVEIVKKVLTRPIKQLLENAGIEDKDIIINKLIKKPINIGYDIRNKEFVDMYKSGIIDPVRVTCSALENAASVAGLILTTKCFIFDEKEDDTIKR